MKLKITSSTTIRDIQQWFSSVYPFLNIKFSDKPHNKHGRMKDDHWYDCSFRIATITGKGIPGDICIRPWHRTGDVEQEFETKFGLHGQIFRREGEEWIETVGTDLFSLSEQNETGKQLTSEKTQSLWTERERLL